MSSGTSTALRHIPQRNATARSTEPHRATIAAIFACFNFNAHHTEQIMV